MTDAVRLCFVILTVLLWVPLFLVGTVYHGFRWCHSNREQYDQGMVVRAVLECALPLLALACILTGTHPTLARGIPCVVLGLIPVTAMLALWWINAERTQVVGARSGVIACALYLHLALIACVMAAMR